MAVAPKRVDVQVGVADWVVWSAFLLWRTEHLGWGAIARDGAAAGCQFVAEFCSQQSSVRYIASGTARKSSEYRRLSILLVKDKKLLLSNHENTNYQDVVNYLKKKVKKRK